MAFADSHATMTGALSVLVLGATGIIGQHLTDVASRCGHRVCAVSRGRNRRGLMPGVEHIAADVRSPARIAGALGSRRFDVVVDLLSYSPDELASTLSWVTPRCGQYVFVSSATVYASAALPDLITEASPRVISTWAYPMLKIECERQLVAHADRSRLQYTIVRPYITYSGQRVPFGPWETHQVLRRLIARRPVVIGNEIAARTTSLTHSEDLARAIVALFANERALNDDFHVASPEQVTWREVYDIAAQVLDTDAHIVAAPFRDIAHAFPDLLGKFADRQLDRAFDTVKLLRACPDFQYQHSVTAGYERSIPEVLSHEIPAPDPFYEGKIDRIVARRTSRSFDRAGRRAFRASLARTSRRSYLSYLSGRFERLERAMHVVRSLVDSTGTLGPDRATSLVGVERSAR